MSHVAQQEQPELDPAAWGAGAAEAPGEAVTRLEAENARLRNAMHAALGLYQTSHIHGLLRSILR